VRARALIGVSEKEKTAMVADTLSSASQRLLSLFNRLLGLAFSQHPLQGSGISIPQLTLLDWVATCPGCSVGQIAEGLDLAPPTVSVGVRRLEKAGLLQRRADPTDRRSVQISTTAQGQALHERALEFRLGKMQQLLNGLTKEEAATLLNLMEKAIDAAAQAHKS
jgi:DNA-binding MarR family transcriptional regulator